MARAGSIERPSPSAIRSVAAFYCRQRVGKLERLMKEPWKSGSLVDLISGGPTLSVVGYDSVGSVIGERFDGPKQERIYLPPDLLIDASPKSEPVSS